jgi:hypothetical protein
MLPCLGAQTGESYRCRHELAKRIYKLRNIFSRKRRLRGRNAMEAILAFGSLIAIWVIVIWGSSYFNRNVT